MSGLDVLIQHFHPLHDHLEDLANIADARYVEGGMIWSVHFDFGQAHSAKLGDAYIRDAAPHDLARFVEPWAKLIASVHAFDEAPTSEQVDVARNVIAIFESAPVQKRFMAFSDTGDSISFESVVLAGRHAMCHSAFWSID